MAGITRQSIRDDKEDVIVFVAMCLEHCFSAWCAKAVLAGLSAENGLIRSYRECLSWVLASHCTLRFLPLLADLRCATFSA